MSFPDASMKKFISNSFVFADALNFVIGNGKELVDPNQLTEMDTAAMVIPYNLVEYEHSKKNPPDKQMYRDVFKKLAFKADDRCSYLLLGIENQSHVHYAMPVKVFLMDALNYTKQVYDIENCNKRNGLIKSPDFLSGLTINDQLTAVITLVINFSDKPWDGPTSLLEMLGNLPKEFEPFVRDYKITVIDPYTMNDEDFKRFRSSLGEVLHFLKYQKDSFKLLNLLLLFTPRTGG